MSAYLGIEPTKESEYYFLSYNTEDAERLQPLVQLMDRNQIPLWYDYGLTYGKKWRTEIAKHIQNCQAMILLLTSGIVEKENSYVLTEYEMATTYFHKPVYVIMVDDVHGMEIPLEALAWWIDVSHKQSLVLSAHPNEQELLREIRKMLKIPEPAAKSAAKPVEMQVEFKTVTDADGTYEGWYLNGKRHGKGKFTWTNGDIYEGDYAYGKITGKGKKIWSSGDIYEGDFVYGECSGLGKYTLATGDVYEGECADGKLIGEGRAQLSNGNIYEGHFANGKYNGQGRYTWPNGEVYEGNFVFGKRTGHGRFTFVNGDSYEGNFKDDEAVGEGRYTWADGDAFEGSFTKGEPSGHGRYFWKNGDVFLGNFAHGKPDGYGKFIWSNGVFYEGNFIDGQADGKVTVTLKNGVSINGVFCNKSAEKTKLAVNTVSSSILLSQVKPFPIIKVGDELTFGQYWQGKNQSDGKTDIQWRVLAREGRKALLISKYVLDAKPYNTEYEPTTWAECTLKKWLNGEFYREAFTAKEQCRILNTEIRADNNPIFNTNPGESITDKLFLLSMQEAKRYFTTDDQRACMPTAYAKANGVYDGAISTQNCQWWLRSPGYRQNLAAIVYLLGSVSQDGLSVDNDDIGVRPALWINLES